MITTTGKSILAKYMLGQTPSYASYIALGCGAKPISSSYNWTTDSSGYKTAFKAKTEMDFEMLRVPIISRGYADGQLVLTAELPTTERYEISEIGIYPALQNPSAGIADSRNLFTFSTSEKWYSKASSSATAVELTAVTSALDESSSDNSIVFSDGVFSNGSIAITAVTPSTPTTGYVRYTANQKLVVGDSVTISGLSPSGYNGTFTVTGIADTYFEVANATTTTVTDATGSAALASSPAFRASATNTLFQNSERIARYELPRFFDSSIFVSGNNAAMATTVDTDAEVLAYSVQSTDKFVLLENTQADLTRNSPSDKIKVALSVVNKDGAGTSNHPDRINVIVDFVDSSNGSFARFGKTEDMSGYSSSNRYIVLSQTIGQMSITNSGSGFTWRDVDTIKIYTSVFDGGSLSTNYFVSFDAIRLENVSSPNPLYGLTGYTVIENTSSQTFVKENNTQALVEFRFSMDVV
jgi:hypothetical protein